MSIFKKLKEIEIRVINLEEGLSLTKLERIEIMIKDLDYKFVFKGLDLNIYNHQSIRLIKIQNKLYEQKLNIKY